MKAHNHMRVFCYRNLHRRGVVWSTKSTKTGLVVDRATTVHLRNCELVVSEVGRQRVLKHQRKNIHAGARGTRVSRGPSNKTWIRLKYNPYTVDKFVDPQGKRVSGAKYVKLCKTGCWGVDLEYIGERQL